MAMQHGHDEGRPLRQHLGHLQPRRRSIGRSNAGVVETGKSAKREPSRGWSFSQHLPGPPTNEDTPFYLVPWFMSGPTVFEWDPRDPIGLKVMCKSVGTVNRTNRLRANISSSTYGQHIGSLPIHHMVRPLVWYWSPALLFLPGPLFRLPHAGLLSPPFMVHPHFCKLILSGRF